MISDKQMDPSRISEIKNAFTAKKITSGIKNPRKIFNFIVALLFDVKIRKENPAKTLASYASAINSLSIISERYTTAQVLKLEEYLTKHGSEEWGCHLQSLLASYGSDKATIHNYHLLYATILGPLRDKRARILEIGLGTNNIDVPSNMGAEGKPGASLRAFRDFAVGFDIIGADVDKRILFEENRIRTFYVDQLNPCTFDDLSSILGEKQFDLIIDDGLHTPEANINTLQFAMNHINKQGYIVIEDIKIQYVPFWKIVCALIGDEFECSILETKSEFLFVARKR